MQTLSVDLDWHAKLIGKTLNLPKNEDIKLHDPTREIWNSLVLSRDGF